MKLTKNLFLSFAASASIATAAMGQVPAPINIEDEYSSYQLSAEDGVDSTSSITTVNVNAGYESELVQERFANGTVKIKRFVVEAQNGDLVNHGEYLEFNEKGEPVATGNYKVGLKDGNWSQQINVEAAKQLTNSSLPGFQAPFTSKASFSNDSLNGDWTLSDANGKLIAIWSYKNGKRHGPSTIFNAKNDVVQSLMYRNNLADGPAKVVVDRAKGIENLQFENGLMLKNVERKFSTVRGGKQVKSKESFLVPTPFNVAASDWSNSKFEYQQQSEKPNIKHGRIVTFFENGVIESEGQFEQGNRTGEFTWFYQNGQRRIEGAYLNGKQDGRWTWWHPNGMRAVSGNFSSGKESGQWSAWAENGKLLNRIDGSGSLPVSLEER